MAPEIGETRKPPAIEVAHLPPDGLALRADLAEQLESYEDALPALAELASRLRASGASQQFGCVSYRPGLIWTK